MMQVYCFGHEWNPYLAGAGTIEWAGPSAYFVNQDTTSRQMSNAQIDDYQGLARRRFRHRPPLTLTVRARFSHPVGELSGTAGFGFWNDPFMMTGMRMPTLPRAIWFFYASPPSDMRLALDVPGHGWKAAVIDALRPEFFLLLPFALPAVLLMNIRPLYRLLWPLAQKAVRVQETWLDLDMTAWHTYVIVWDKQRSQFWVDGKTVMANAPSPRGPLGFVMWFDNQYMVATPWGRFRYGLLNAPGRQWMQVDDLKIEEGQ